MVFASPGFCCWQSSDNHLPKLLLPAATSPSSCCPTSFCRRTWCIILGRKLGRQGGAIIIYTRWRRPEQDVQPRRKAPDALG